MLVSDVMRPNVYSIGLDTTVAEAARMIMTRNVQNVIVTDDGRLAGVVGWQELLTAVLPGTHVLMQAEKVPDFEALVSLSHEHTYLPAKEVMRTGVLTTGPDVPAARALALMLASHAPFLPVIDQSRRLVGILSLRELLAAFFFPDKPRAAGQS